MVTHLFNTTTSTLYTFQAHRKVIVDESRNQTHKTTYQINHANMRVSNEKILVSVSNKVEQAIAGAIFCAWYLSPLVLFSGV
jgi:hypothetical protein